MADIYREALLERLANPVNHGVLDKPDLEAALVNPLCGDEVKIGLKINKDTIEQAVYSGNGCALSQVSASFLAEKVEGQKLSELKKIKESDILELVGVTPGPARQKCLLLPFQVLKKLLENR